MECAPRPANANKPPRQLPTASTPNHFFTAELADALHLSPSFTTSAHLDADEFMALTKLL